MSAENASDVIDRMEAIAPNLKPVKLVDFDKFVCCSEVLKEPEETPCEIPRPVTPECVCMCKKWSCPLCPKCKLENERTILFRPVRFRCPKSPKVVPKRIVPTLGAPVGLSKSSFNMRYLESRSSDTEISLQGFATVLIAFAEYFITPEVEWDEQILNHVLLEGQRLYTESKRSLTDGERLKELTVKKTFMLCKNSFDIVLDEPFLIGQVAGVDRTVHSLYWGLAKFFKKFQFCLLQIDHWYVLIWRNFDVYFVFDCFGRRFEDFRKDKKSGVAMLICLRTYDNVSHLILNLSGIRAEQVFTIRRVQIKSLVACGGRPTPDIVDRPVEFEVLNDDYALLRANLHLGSECFREIRYRHSLPVAICALINAKIDATPTWDCPVLDKIIKLGAEFYKIWTQRDLSLDLGIQDIPNRFVFGQFMVEIAVEPIAECGLWKCTPNYRHSDITKALQRAFENGSNIIVQIQGRSYALWKKGSFYFVLDPYSHLCSLGKKKLVTGSMRMCGTIERLCCVFTQSLLELFEESKFVIHLLKILYLEELDKIEENIRRAQVPCTCIATPQTDWSQEVASINDSVLGVEGYDCICEELPQEGPDSADLDSPGLSQTRLEDYTDLRKTVIEDSAEETDEEEDAEDIDLDDDNGDDKPQSDDDDDEKQRKAKPKKKDKKDKKGGADDDKKKKKMEAENEKRKKKEEEDQRKQAEKEAKEKAKREKAEREKAEKEQAAREKAEREQAEKERASQLKEQADKEKAEREKAEREKAEKEKAEKDKAAKEKADKEKAEREKAEREKAEREKAEREKAEREGAAREQGRTEGDGTDKAKTDEASDETKGRTDEKPAAKDDSSKRKRRKETELDESSIPNGCKPNSYPGYTEDLQDLAVVGSESGNYGSLCILLKSAFRCTDRVLTMTPWGNYVAFHSGRAYFIFDGCTCNLRSIRHMDLTVGTAGLLCFCDLHSLLEYIEDGKHAPRPTTLTKKTLVDQICCEYC